MTGRQKTMDPFAVNEAAHLFHEASYDVARLTANADDSDLVRKFNGEVFSWGPIKTQIRGKVTPESIAFTSQQSPTTRILDDIVVLNFKNKSCLEGARAFIKVESVNYWGDGTYFNIDGKRHFKPGFEPSQFETG